MQASNPFPSAPPLSTLPLDLLRCPISGEPLRLDKGMLVSSSGAQTYRITPSGIPLFAEQFCSPEARAQQRHYDRVSVAYMENLNYPHTIEYMRYLDRALLRATGEVPLGTVVEICCGRGEVFGLLGHRIDRGIGIDVSLSMLEEARKQHAGARYAFVQGEATRLPLCDESTDTAVMLGGIHHVNDRFRLFSEIRRILKPGGRFVFREPVSDLALWRWLRAVIYRLSPSLDHGTERPLRYRDTVPVLHRAGLRPRDWRTYGFLGFCLFMNSDVLVFNRIFRFVPFIGGIARLAARLDDLMLRPSFLSRIGLQVVGVAEKPRAL